MSTERYIRGYSSSGEDGLATIDVLKVFGIEARPDRLNFLSLVLKIFRIGARQDRLEFLPLEYDATNSCELSIVEADRKAIALTVFRPCLHERFWCDVFELLSRGPYLAFMPDSPAPVLVNPEVSEHLPEGMVEALGSPRQVASPGGVMSVLTET